MPATTALTATVRIELGVGAVDVHAEETCTEPTVEVRPADPGNAADVRAAERAEVITDARSATIRVPRRILASRAPGAVEVTATVPAGSSLDAKLGVASLRATGRLGDCRAMTGVGDLTVQEVGTAHLASGTGDVTVGRATGDAHLSTATGELQVGTVDGTASLKSSYGAITVTDARGDLRARSAAGDVRLGRAAGDVDARSAYGAITVGGAGGGRLDLATAAGSIEVGVPEGTAAWLDVQTDYGEVRNELQAGDAPAAGDGRLEVRARTGVGDITIRRAAGVAAV
jgi:hypothetical protein